VPPLRDPARASTAPLGPVTRADVEQIALMDPARRDQAVGSLASVQALAGLLREVHDVERALESGELRATPEVREEMERRRAQLRGEMGRLLEVFEMDRRVNLAVSDAQRVAWAEMSGRARERLAPRRAREAQESIEEPLKPWGCEVKRTKGDGYAQQRQAAP